MNIDLGEGEGIGEWTTMNTVIATGMGVSFLSQRALTQRIANNMKNSIAARYSAAHARNPNSLKGRMWTHMKAGSLGQKFMSVSGRSFMRAFGWPGMLAYGIYAITKWKLDQIVETDNALVSQIKDLEDDEFKSPALIDMLADSTYAAEFAKPLQMGDSGDEALLKARKKRVLDLMRGQSEANLTKIISVLKNGGWTSQDIVDFVNTLKAEKSGDLSSLNLATTQLQSAALLGEIARPLDGDGTIAGSMIGKLTGTEDNSLQQYFNTMIFVSGEQPKSWLEGIPYTPGL